MKKILFAIFATTLAFGMFTLAGCGDEDKMSIKDFVPAEFENQSEGEDAIEGFYICDAKDFVKKTQGILGKSKKKCYNIVNEEKEMPGLNLEIPADAKRIAIEINRGLNIGIEKNKTTKIEDMATGAIDGLAWWNVDENEEYFTEEKATKFNSICCGLYGDECSFLGTYGTINGKEVIVNKEQGLIFTKIEEDDYEELLKQNAKK